MEVVARNKHDFILKYYFLSFVVAWHSYLNFQNGSTESQALIVLAMAITISASLLRHRSNLRSPMMESFRMGVRYAAVFFAIAGIKHFVSSSSLAEGMVSLALFFTPAMIIETVFFSLDRALGMPFARGASDEV